MNKTKNFGLNLIEASDPMSLKPLNENAEKIDAALLAQQTVIAGKLMMAKGVYTGDGNRVVTIQTPGFKPHAVIVRSKGDVITGDYAIENRIAVKGGWCIWLGADLPASYSVYARADEVSNGVESGELRRDNLSADISFAASAGSLSWSIPKLPPKYYDVRSDEGSNVVNNREGDGYEWIAFGTAE